MAKSDEVYSGCGTVLPAPTNTKESFASSAPATGQPVLGLLISVNLVNFFDFAGGQEYYEVRNEFYSDAQGALLVFDVSSKATLDALSNWLKEGEQHGMRAPAMMLCGNKTDNKKREVSEADARRWAGAHGGMAYYETSAKDGDNVHKMFDKLFADAAKSAYKSK